MTSLNDGKGLSAATPSPLRRMEDPTKYHVMPSARKADKLMPPPAPRVVSKKPKVLDEDTYIAAMGEIIERDFYPDLPKLQRQLKWLEAVDRKDMATLTHMRKVMMSEQRFTLAPDTPRTMRGEDREGEAETMEVTRAAGINPTVSLDSFLAKYTSEDNSSFEELADKMREQHKQRYWWVYSNHPMIEAGKAPLYIKADGSLMTEEERRLRDEATAAVPRIGDDRPNEPEGWKYRQRNALMFQPELEQTLDTCKVGMKPSALPLLLDNGPNTSLNQRVGEGFKAPKSIVHSNTRLPPEQRGSRPSPLERPRSDLTSLSADTTEEFQSNEGLVAMTPAILPGAGGQSPLMTWGDVMATPLLINEPFEMSAGTKFSMSQPSFRERVGNQLDLEAKRKKNKSGSTPKVGGKGGATPLGTPMGRKRSLAELTPAQQSLASKLASAMNKNKQATAFGGGMASELRASYTGTREQGSTSGLNSRAFTPGPSPMRVVKKLKRGEERRKETSSSLTDNLLDI